MFPATVAYTFAFVEKVLQLNVIIIEIMNKVFCWIEIVEELKFIIIYIGPKKRLNEGKF